jgi:hypothetical protein
MGAMPPHPRDGRTLLAHLGGAHTHLHNHIRRCRHRIRRYRITVWVRFGCCTVVCTSSSACRVTMGHWGQCHHIPGMAGHCLVTLGGRTHTSTTTFGVGLPMHRIRPLVRIAQRRLRVSNGGVHVILSMQGHHGALGAMPPYIPGMAGHCLATLGGGAHTHCIRPLVRIAQRGSGVVRWRVRDPQQLGPQLGIALPNCTAKATHIRIAGHCLVTFGAHTHTSKTTFGVANTVFVTVRIAVWVSYGGVDTIFSM